MLVSQEVISAFVQSGLDPLPEVEVISDMAPEDQLEALFEIIDATYLPRATTLSSSCGDTILMFAARGQLMKIENDADSPLGNPLTLYWALEDFVSLGGEIAITQYVIPMSALVKLKGVGVNEIRNAPNPKPAQLDDSDKNGGLCDAREA
ncbi:hypothetical protein [Aliiroseovarius sp. 2305UL8-7]|uniref:hypothetical protein n=1 Tax=Aliiroseovarius conchicola TaxID=3121637 RepID=UPI0035280F53